MFGKKNLVQSHVQWSSLRSSGPGASGFVAQFAFVFMGQNRPSSVVGTGQERQRASDSDQCRWGGGHGRGGCEAVWVRCAEVRGSDLVRPDYNYSSLQNSFWAAAEPAHVKMSNAPLGSHACAWSFACFNRLLGTISKWGFFNRVWFWGLFMSWPPKKGRLSAWMLAHSLWRN